MTSKKPSETDKLYIITSEVLVTISKLCRCSASRWHHVWQIA